MHFVYIIHSEDVNKYYVGETSHVEHRLALHKNHYFKGAYTRMANDWELVLKFECRNRSEALFIEKFIKRMKSTKFIKKIIQTPTILSDIIEKHRTE
ncbi:GIY-YIG nuclease family protein [Psychroflexus sediminis]|nr:GIY-YIG nuclease family protein [Psychroflexus sediminis]